MPLRKSVLTSTVTLAVAVTGLTGLAAAPAFAKHGADDAPGHVRHGRGADDSKAHRAKKGADDSASSKRRGRGSDDAPGHVRHSGDDDGPNHT